MDWLSHLADAPLANILFLAGLAFLAIGVLGKIAGKIEPDKVGRVAAAVVGVALICGGLYMHVKGDQNKDQGKQASNGNTVSPTPTPENRQGRTVEPVRPPVRRTPANNINQRPVGPNQIVGRHDGINEPVNFPVDRPTPVPNNAANGSYQGGSYVPPKIPRSPDTCKPGYVWREAFPNDHVCVIPTIRSLMARENSQASLHRNPAGGPYGPDTCLQGYVWREAEPSDRVCVVPEVRRQVAIDNAQAASRRE